MSEGLTPDEIEDFYADTTIAVKPVEVNPAKIKINVLNIDDYAEPVSVKIKSETINDTLCGEDDVVVAPIKRRKAVGIDPGTARLWRRRLGTVVTVLVAICALTLVGMRIAGFRTFTVMSGSMEPDYSVGSMIYVKPVDYKSLKEGDVISFVANNEKTVVTHRIAEIQVDENDSEVWRFKTKGDANNTADAQLVHYKNVIGTPIIKIPFIGYLAHNIQQPPGIYIALVVGTLLLAWTFLPGTLEGRRKTARNTAL